MDEARALTIVSALANGVNPLTGELFAIDSPYQSPDVIRAMYCAVRALEAAGRRRTRGQGAGVGQRRQAVDGRGGSSAAVGVRRRAAARGAGAGARPHARRHSGASRAPWSAVRRRATGRSAGRASGGPGTAGASASRAAASARCRQLYNAPRSYVQRFPPSAIAERCARAARPCRVNIIGKSNGVGLARDIDLLAGALQASGHQVDVTIIDAVQAGAAARRWRSSRRARGSRGAAPAPRRRPRARTSTSCSSTSGCSTCRRRRSTSPCRIPSGSTGTIGGSWREVDTVWAKTVYTRELFRALGCSTTYIGFDSEDRYESQHREAAHVFPPRRQEHDERHGSPGARLAAASRVAAPDPGAAQGRRRRCRRSRRTSTRASVTCPIRSCAAAERKPVSSVPVAHRRLGALHRRGDGRRRRDHHRRRPADERAGRRGARRARAVSRDRHAAPRDDVSVRRSGAGSSDRAHDRDERRGMRAARRSRARLVRRQQERLHAAASKRRCWRWPQA